jgi:hypothetical protein
MEIAARSETHPLVTDLRRIFGERLHAVVAYGGTPSHWARNMVLVESLNMDDLTALAAAAPGWHAQDIATPLILPRAEFAQSLDAFPVEYGEIIETHQVLAGKDPFDGVEIAARDLRRALETRTASHLLHLRENFVEIGGRPAMVDALVRESAPAFQVLLRRMAGLDRAAIDSPTALARWAADRAGLEARVVGDILAIANEPAPAVDAVRLFPAYLDAVEALLHTIDRWPVS